MSNFEPECGPLPSPDLEFETWNDCLKYCKEHAAVNGYGLAVKNYYPNKQNCMRVELRCSKGRGYESDDRFEQTDRTRKRQGKTQMTSCPIQVACRIVDGKWKVGFKKHGHQEQQHNHPASDVSAFSEVRRQRIEPYKHEIIELWNNGISPAQILTRLHQKPELECLQRWDITNLLSKHTRDELAGKVPIEWLYETLQNRTGDYWFREKRDDQGRVEFLFVARRTGMTIFQRYPYILKIDANYKTNRFSMPLLNICGSTSSKSSPNLAICFMKDGTEPSFTWVLGTLVDLIRELDVPTSTCICTDRDQALMNALANSPVFGRISHVLCQWRINMNVITKTKEHFPKGYRNPATGIMQDSELWNGFYHHFKRIQKCHTIDSYKMKLRTFQERGKYPEAAVQYCMTAWINPWKEKFCAIFTDQYTHFESLTMSIGESSNTNIKTIINSSKGDLRTFFEILELFWTQQATNIDNMMHRGLYKTNPNVDVVLKDIAPYVSDHCLDILQEQLRKIPQRREPNPEFRGDSCWCPVKKISGLPCCHRLHWLKFKGGRVTIDDVHPFWFWNRCLIPQRTRRSDANQRERSRSPVQDDPRARRNRCRPRSEQPNPRARGYGEYSSQRDPIEVEYVETTAGRVTTRAGLRRIQEQGGDTYQPGTQTPRSSDRTAAEDADEDDGNVQGPQNDEDEDEGERDNSRAGRQVDNGIRNLEEDIDDTQGIKEADCIEVQAADDSDYFDYALDEDLDEMAM